jgi:hypothetical protein
MAENDTPLKRGNALLAEGDHEKALQVFQEVSGGAGRQAREDDASRAQSCRVFIPLSRAARCGHVRV